MMQQFWNISREWDGETCFIIAGGPSVTQDMVDRLRGRKVIAINLSFEKAPWADFLYFNDHTLNKMHRAQIHSFAGRIVTSGTIPEQVLTLRCIKRPCLPTDTDSVFVLRTSVTGAMCMAKHLGARRQILLGLDGKVGDDGRTHHYTPHPLRKNCFDEQRMDFLSLVEPLKASGVEVFNVNQDSNFRMFPFMELDAALAH